MAPRLPFTDEGFSFNLTGEDGLPRYVGVVWRKDGVIVRSQANIGNVASRSLTADSNAALAIPMSVAQPRIRHVHGARRSHNVLQRRIQGVAGRVAGHGGFSG